MITIEHAAARGTAPQDQAGFAPTGDRPKSAGCTRGGAGLTLIFKWATGCAVSVFASLSAATAQDVSRISLSDEVCSECAVRFTPLVRLGDEEGPGSLDAGFVRVVHGGVGSRYAVFPTDGGGTEVLLFSSHGRFDGRVGGQGGGPGEFMGIRDLEFHGSQLLVLDWAGPRLTVFEGDGGVVTVRRVEAPPGRIGVLSDSTIVVAAMGFDPSMAGFPLHEVDMRTGRALRRFGSEDGRWSVADAFAGQVLLGRSPDRSRIWLGGRDPSGRPYFQEWEIESGRLVRVVVGPRHMVSSPTPRDEALPTTIEDFAVDRQERRWVLSHVPKDGVDWSDVPPTPGGERLITMESKDRFYRSRLDVFDLRAERHIGRSTWDGMGGLLTVEGRLAVFTTEFLDGLIPTVGVGVVRLPLP